MPNRRFILNVLIINITINALNFEIDITCKTIQLLKD